MPVICGPSWFCRLVYMRTDLKAAMGIWQAICRIQPRSLRTTPKEPLHTPDIMPVPLGITLLGSLLTIWKEQHQAMLCSKDARADYQILSEALLCSSYACSACRRVSWRIRWSASQTQCRSAAARQHPFHQPGWRRPRRHSTRQLSLRRARQYEWAGYNRRVDDHK